MLTPQPANRMQCFRLPVLAGLLSATSLAWSAPLFPDLGSDHWAREAVSRLIQKGLVEGYRDGTFKGDRAVSRHELALWLARTLERLHSEGASLASRDLLDECHRLARQLRPELEALGLRVENLEGAVGRLEQRTQELERLTFYGSVESRVIGQAFVNRGSPTNRGVTPLLDYNQVVGASPGPAFRPQIHGVIPIVDYRNGRALVNGAGFTSLARLGVKANLGDGHEAGLELAAFSSQGNNLVDAYWGISAPFQANVWTANNLGQGISQGLNHSPYSRAVFDRAWYEHKASQTRVNLGTFESLKMDRFIYVGQGNNCVLGPPRFPGFGVQVHKGWSLGENQELQLEIFNSRFGDGGNLYLGDNYLHTVWGADVSYRHGRSKVQLNWVRYYDESADGLPATGLNNITNVAYANSGSWNQVQWVNPPGHFALQRSPAEIAGTGAQAGTFQPNLIDSRPIAGWNANADNTLGILQGAGNFGPQAQTTYGLSAETWIPFEGEDGLKLLGQFGRSEYKSNRNSSYLSKGNLMRLEAQGKWLEGALHLSLAAHRIDPNYNPALFNAALLGIRFVRPYNFIGRFHLHDSGAFPQNRTGLLLRGDLKLLDGQPLEIGWKAGLSQQTQTSLYDVRVRGGALGPGIPTQDVIGFAPGFFDPVFPGLAHPNLYGPRSGNSFDANLQPLENPRGQMQEWGLYLKYRWDDPALTLDTLLERNTYRRQTRLGPSQGGSQNHIDLTTDYARLGLSWKFHQDWTLRTGTEVVSAYGHHDPGGVFNDFALASGSVNFTNLHSTQVIPYIGLDFALSARSNWSLDLTYYNTRDRTDRYLPGASSFSWSGPQVSTTYRMTF